MDKITESPAEKPSHIERQLQQRITDLEMELQSAELKVARLNEELEKTVYERTRELAREICKRSDAEKFIRSTIDALNLHVCVIDSQGKIIITNRYWNEHAASHCSPACIDEDVTSHINSCDSADDCDIRRLTGEDGDFSLFLTRSRADGESTLRFADGIQAVLNGSLDEFVMVYACKGKAAKECCWFVGKVNPFVVNGIQYAVISHEDITERKKATEELRKLSRVVEQAPVSIMITDDQGMIEFVNPRFSVLTGYRAEEVIGRSSRLLKSGQTPPETYRQLWSTITAGETWEGEYLNKGKDGTLFWEQTSISPLRDERGAITHFLAVKENITEKKAIAEEFKAAKEQAEAASKAKSEFMAVISHEVRTPMNGVLGMASLLLDTELDDTQRDFAGTVYASGEKLLKIINEILDFSKIESGKMNLEIIDFDLRLTFENVMRMFVHRAKESRLELSCRINPDVPPYLKGDPERLFQIIINLVGNALKFTSHGRVDISAALVSVQESAADIMFEVADTGIGIPAEQLDHIFDPFTQADGSTTRKYGGTGLGLSICRQLAELMGSDISVSSQEGKGSTFRFTVRFKKQADSIAAVSHALTAPKAAPAAPQSPTVQVQDTAGDNGGARILVAEDDVINQRVAQSFLKSLGYRFTIVNNGQEAVQALSGEEYHLVLMDCMMPDMDGFEASACIRDPASDVLNHDVPIIAMTAKAMKGDREKCIAAGMSDYLSKPVKKEEIAAMLEKWL